MRVVARDHEGWVILSSSKFHPVCSIVEDAEICSCLAGLYVAVSMHTPIILKTNCKAVCPNMIALTEDCRNRDAKFQMSKITQKNSLFLNI
jgi:hypothetical protein